MSKKQQVVILGGGESGTGAALLAASKGFSVFLSDKGMLGETYRQQLQEQGIAFEEGQHSEEKILAADLLIKSPGIPDTAPLVQQLRAKGVAVIDELSFALRYTDAKVIAITGTNGKTTTTLLTYHLLKEGGLNVGLAGNVGISLAALLAQGNVYDWLVLEVSSFQLDGMPGFSPEAAILLNITPDHLDRYDYKLEKYVASKLHIGQHLKADAAFIYYAEDPLLQQGLASWPVTGQLLPVAGEREEAMALLEQDWIRIKGPVKDTLLPYQDMVLQGKHNYLNTACAVLAAFRAGVPEFSIRESLHSFQNAPHRLERLAKIGGIEWINDSKATNVDAAWYALDAVQAPIIWIAGGVDKGNEYRQLEELVRQKVKTLVCMGKDNSKLIKAFSGMVPQIYDTADLQTAIDKAILSAEPGDVVLLAPACASFDLFKNYIDRGEQFRSKVNELKTRQEEV